MKRRGKFRTRYWKDGRMLYAIRNADGTFADIQDPRRTVLLDRRRKAKTKVKPGRGFRGDTKK